MTNLMNEAKAAAATQDQSAGAAKFEYAIAPAGYTTARFIGYVETGKQPQRAYEGVEKPDAATVRLTFELNGAKHKVEYNDTDGVLKTRNNVIRQSITISTHEKANFTKLFHKMKAGRTNIKHMAELLGEGFLIKITHSTSKDGKKTYANMKNPADGWTIGAPIKTDVETNEVQVMNVPEATQDLQLLIWGSPSKAQWDSIFIDGTYEREVDGQKVTVSKNFIQEEAISASNFSGSPLEALIMGTSDIVAAIATPATQAAPKPAAAQAPTDVLASLGL